MPGRTGRDCTPTEIWQGSIGKYPERFTRIDWRFARRAKMGPIVAEVEDIDELLLRLETREFQDSLVQNGLFGFRVCLWDSDPRAIAKLEFMQM